MDDDSPMAQPLFGPPETPAKTILPEDYNPETGNTPLHGEGWQMTHARVNCDTDRPGVPGHTASTNSLLPGYTHARQCVVSGTAWVADGESCRVPVMGHSRHGGHVISHVQPITYIKK